MAGPVLIGAATPSLRPLACNGSVVEMVHEVAVELGQIIGVGLAGGRVDVLSQLGERGRGSELVAAFGQQPQALGLVAAAGTPLAADGLGGFTASCSDDEGDARPSRGRGIVFEEQRLREV